MADISGVLFGAPAQGIIAYVSTVAQPNPGRGVLIDCTTGGTLTLQFGDATSVTLNVATATVYQLNWAITKYTAGTAVVAGVYLLK